MIHPDLITLEELVRKHDWYFDYSDDHSVWKRGRDVQDEIRRQMDICCGLGLSHLAEEIYNKHCPFKVDNQP